MSGIESRAVPLGSGAFDVVACASSAGGLNALTEVLTRIPVDFQAAITVVQHLDRRHRSLVVVDRDFKVLSWVEKMRELWGLRSDEVVGQSLFDLDIGLPVAELRPAIERCLRGEENVARIDLDAVNRRGAPIRCGVICTPLRRDDEVTGAIVLMQRIDGDAAGNRGP